MKLTVEIEEKKDPNGNLIDFVTCTTCYHFIHFENEPIGSEIKFRYCNIDKYVRL
jgi:hypothetical protein